MRISIIAIGSRGDVQPHIALGMRLQTAGYNIRLVTHAIFEPLVNHSGLDFSVLSVNPRDVVENETGQDWIGSGNNFLHFFRRFSRIAGPLIQQTMQDCWQACQHSEAIIFSPLAICTATSIAEKLHIPYWIGCGQPLTPTSAFASPFFPAIPGWLPFLSGRYNHLTHGLSARLFWQLIGPLVNKARAEVLDLPPLPSQWLYDQLCQQRLPILYYYSPSVLPQPSDWNAKSQVTGYWFLDNDANWQPPADLLAFLAAGPPPIYVGFGSMNTRNAQAMTGTVLQAIAHTKQRGILLTGWGGISAAHTRDDIFTIDFVPHAWLFPQMAAVVHHGGAGTLATSLRTGVPTIIVPFFGDQPFWGRRLHDLGVVPKPIPQKRLTVQRLANAIEIAIADADMRSRMKALSKHIQTEDGLARAVDILQRSLYRAH